MSTAKKWILGVAIIIVAVAGVLIAWLDNDPATQPNIPDAIGKIKDGVDIIQRQDAVAPATEKE